MYEDDAPGGAGGSDAVADHRDNPAGRDPDSEFRVFVGGLNFDTDNARLASHFADIGTVVKAEVKVYPENGRSKGYGFVTFDDVKSVNLAIEKMDGTMLDGKTVKVSEARRRTDRRPDYRYDGGGRGGYRDYGGRGYGGSGGYGGGRGYDSRSYGDRRPVDRPRGPGFQVYVSGLPDEISWKELKDFLRGPPPGWDVIFADVKSTGYGYSRLPRILSVG